LATRSAHFLGVKSTPLDREKIGDLFLYQSIIRIITYGDGFPTAKGVKTGETKEKVIQRYGKEYYERFEQGSNIIGYVDKKLNRTLEFWFLQGMVDAIRLDIGSMQ
jgi:hypothetical protein